MAEHRHVACVPNGFETRCPRSSGQHVRWAHRLKVYVPTLTPTIPARQHGGTAPVATAVSVLAPFPVTRG